MAAPDYAKILAAFDLGAQNPILGPVMTASMWTPPGLPLVKPGPNIEADWVKGWFRKQVDDGTGSKVYMYDHSGLLSGSRTYIGRREDGISFVFFTNGHEDLGGAEGSVLSDVANGVLAWPDHDLFPGVGLPAFRKVPGTITPFGLPCTGSAGTPGMSYNGTAETARTFNMILTLARPQAPAWVVVGTKAALPLVPFGAAGCTLYALPGLVYPAAVSPLGTAVVPWFVPPNPSLIGYSFAAQFVFLDSSANPAGLVTTNGLEIKIGGWLGF